MTKREALNGKPYAGNPHVRFDEGEAASTATSRRGSLLYMEKIVLVVFGMLVGGVWADEPRAQKSVDADLYGIADPTQRLAAIRAKWPNAGGSGFAVEDAGI